MSNVLVVDEELMSCHLLKYYIDESEKYNCVMATDETECVEKYLRKYEVELLLLDICSLKNECGFKIARKIKKNFPKLRIILMTKYPEYSYIVRAKKSKSDSFWYKVADAKDLIDIIDKTMIGQNIYPEKTIPVMLGNVSSEDLSEKEIEVLRELVKGETDADIARCIHMSIRSVKGYIQSMRSKTGFRNRTELAVQARALGLVMNHRDSLV